MTFLLLVLAGIGAGLTGSVAGIASLVSYPALLAAGLGPVTANVTNTVALVFQGLGSVHGSRPELRGQSGLVRRLIAPCVLGGITGGVLLTRTSPDAFAKIVPWLIGFSALAVLVRPGPPQLGSARDGRSIAMAASCFGVGVYGGYFGAAAGVMLLALLLAYTGDTVARVGALRTVLLGSANAVAALYFTVSGSVAWAAVVPLAIGLFAGGRAGPVLVRHAPAGPLRVLIALLGAGLAIRLGLAAY